MSMINQALRRANQAPGRQPVAEGPALRPTDPPPYPGGEVGLLLPTLLVIVVALAVALFWAALHPGRPTEVRARTIETPPAVQAAALVASTAPSATPTVTTKVPTPATAATAAAATAASNTVIPASSSTLTTASASLSAGAPNTPSATATATAMMTAPPATNPAASVATQPEPAVPVAYKLETIFYRPDRPSAVINGRFLHVGDQLDDVTVESIKPDVVTIVSASGQRTRLELY
jgi:hypothetical protein